ncbi:MAG: hypothetical protein BZ151_08690 [Desulfobacca sp. 4484_104]|nr:MAG: hypothetical protein BZ151_08690 [Desulfobacca sp. 4484_104]
MLTPWLRALRSVVIITFLITLSLTRLTILKAYALIPPQASVVTVVSLDGQGQPLRQGWGVVVEPQGLVLTSLATFHNGQGGVLVTPPQTLHLITGLVFQDKLQDLALLTVEAEGLKPVPVRGSQPVKINERLWLPVRKNSQLIFQEVKVQGLHTISPRLKLIELGRQAAAGLPGTPVFNQQGELIGMGHQLDQPDGGQETTCYYLLLNPSSWPSMAAGAPKPLAVSDISESSHDLSAATWFWPGLAALVAQDWDQANKQFSAALNVNPQFPEAYYGRAQARFFLKDFSGAEQDLNQALKYLPDYDRAYFWLGKTLQRLNRQPEARLAYHRAVQINPDLAEAHFQLGELAYQARDWPRAEHCFNQARQGCPQAAHSWYYLGTIAQSRRQTSQAVLSFKKAIELNPQFFDAYLALGKLLWQEGGRAQEAVQILSQGVQHNPQNSEARLYLALAQLLSRDRGGALEQYLILQDLNPRLAARLSQVMARGR